MSAPAAPACRNCGTPAAGNFCPECGQDTAPHPPSAREFLHEFIGHYVALEGALWRTLAKLLRPGALTLEYFAGRKRHYVLPLRLYLTASILFFVVAKVVAPMPEIRITVGGRVPGAAAVEPAKRAIPCKAPGAACDRVNAYVVSRYGELTSSQWRTILGERLARTAPTAMFVLLPLFALITRVAYWNRRRNYGEHLVFALHLHAFAFFLATALVGFSNMYLFTVPFCIYLGMALRRVFAGREWPSMLRFLFVVTAYGVSIVAAVFAILLAAVFI